MKDNRSLDDFSLLIDKKVKYLEELMDLTKKQTELINKVEFEDLQILTNKKDEIIYEVDDLDKKITPLLEEVLDIFKLDRNNWLNIIQKKEEVPEKTRENIKRLVDILAELQKIDNTNLKMMKEQRQELNKDMQEVHEGRRVNKGYNSNNRIYSTFIDKKS